MPHCKVEITKNLFVKVDKKILMQDLSQALFDTGCYEPDDIKVRLYETEHSFMGIVDQEHSYVAAEISTHDTKTEEELQRISENVHKVLLLYFEETIGRSSITTRVSLMEKKYYRKKVNY